MRIFVHELTCAETSASGSPAHALRKEGWAMLSALLEDFGRVRGVQPCTILHSSSPAPWEERVSQSGGVCYRTEEGTLAQTFQDLVRAADCTLVIAPEFDNLLLDRCNWVETAGRRLLGSSPEAIALAGDKLALAQHLRERGIPTPDCRPLIFGKDHCTLPLVVKPRYGAGSQATFLVRQADELAACAKQARAEGWTGELMEQPFVSGMAVSVAFLMGRRNRMALLPGRQRLSKDGRFHYRGGVLPLPASFADRTIRLAERAIDSVVGLNGYVGVDLVLGAACDGSEDWIIEINPRLTTAYLGQRALAESNLAAAMLGMALGDEVRPLAWRSGWVTFQANGRVQTSPKR
jgi:predicted ATP-grasp superfamily ATP-dependent carboligase